MTPTIHQRRLQNAGPISVAAGAASPRWPPASPPGPSRACSPRWFWSPAWDSAGKCSAGGRPIGGRPRPHRPRPLADDGLGDPAAAARPAVWQSTGQSLRRQTISRRPGGGPRRPAGRLPPLLLRVGSRPASRQPPSRAAAEGRPRPAGGPRDGCEPTAEEPGKWRLYDLPGSLPLVVGIREGNGRGPQATPRLSLPNPPPAR